ncbi:hypothetical protein LGL55_18860 [Clostridium tagluense]|uniref:hypothetical protein n=1 Tax=Clostridium tagluense TaxID=360422 RepID=UPI001C0C6218|nr:hypothetical protein [Clostridium tagluense]MBU3130003.1 hypothetical protein [Clostridium tagluense]MCB2311882.1 hypothetical protein [Clostridium tagluense]MCB2317364.1 hypothetical protein [Clostridium tagluense]MCB2322844.1 hypothetical protein [Clostridium tagluense]MCB2326918.1 hypothetical protein [Clostridium tagluense]
MKELPYTDAERKEILQGIHETRDEVNAIKNSRGKLSWAVKALRVAWDKIPTKVKTAIGGYVGFEKMMDVIENYTGAIEDGIYKGVLEVTGNSTAAWWISKTLMLFL